MRPMRRLLDLFCGAGGAAAGYARAGFDVTGIDIAPQPDYPFTFWEADAMASLLHGTWREFDAIHASPPCQDFTTMSNRHRGKGGKADSHIDLLTPVRERFSHIDIPWVIENVVGSKGKMRPTLILHGGMFGLRVDRPRYFESNVMLWAPEPADHTENPIGVYGARPDGRRLWTRADGSEQRAASSIEEARAAMGMDWGDWDGVREAIPPAYTEWIGTQLLHAIESAA